MSPKILLLQNVEANSIANSVAERGGSVNLR